MKLNNILTECCKLAEKIYRQDCVWKTIHCVKWEYDSGFTMREKVYEYKTEAALETGKSKIRWNGSCNPKLKAGLMSL